MKPKVAIDVGSAYIKVIEGLEKKGKLYIKKIGCFPNPFANIREEIVERQQDIFVKSLKTFLRRYAIGCHTCISSVSGRDTIIHYFDIPQRLPQEELTSAINLELMQVTPGGTKSLEYDYLLLPGKENKQTVLFIGYPQDKCEFYINCLQRAGLKPLVMDHDSFAILNAFRFLNPGMNNEIVFLINIGNRNSNFALAEPEKGFLFIRDIPFGGQQITEIIARKKHITIETAEIYKNKQENKQEVKQIILEDMEDLMSDVSKSIEYFRTTTGKSPACLFLTGGASVIPGICESFRNSLKMDVDIWNPLESLSKDMSFLEDLKQQGVGYSVALGLVLRDIK